MLDNMNTEPKEDPAVVRAYAFIGLCATQYATLEFHTQFLLSFLHMAKELSVETIIFTRHDNFSEKLKLIKEFAAYRLNNNAELRDKTIALATDIDKQREKRNHFIHGYWLVNEALVMQKMVRVSDTKWKYDKDRVGYHAMETTDISLDELEKLPHEIGGLIERLHKLLEELKAEEVKIRMAAKKQFESSNRGLGSTG